MRRITVRMFKTPPAPWQLALLGHHRRQQIPIAMTLAAVAVYVVYGLAQWLFAYLGHVSMVGAAALTSVNLVGQSIIYAALRSGWSQRFADPGLTMAQMVFALVAVAAGYLINAEVRGALLMIDALVLVFGAFTLPPRRCRQLGWLALALMGSVMALGALSSPAVFDPVVEGVTFACTAATLPLIGHLAGRLSGLRGALRQQKTELRQALERVNVLATRDELTTLPNRRFMQDLITREMPRLRRRDAPLCIAVLDLDHFKAVNDRHGHSVGDKVLKTFATEALTVLRDADTLARWGGEEFLLMMPDTPPALALMVIQRLHEHLRQPASWERCREARVTFSAGLAVQDPKEPFEQTLERADRALYEAKRLGRDRCVEAEAASAATCPTQLTLLEYEH